jgi:hypothetical protein
MRWFVTSVKVTWYDHSNSSTVAVGEATYSKRETVKSKQATAAGIVSV